jgi:hypothetical protein
MATQDNHHTHTKKMSGNVNTVKLKENTYKITFDSVRKWSNYDSENPKSMYEQLNDWAYTKFLPKTDFKPTCTIKLDKKKIPVVINSAKIKNFCLSFNVTTQKKISEGKFTNAKLSVDVTSIPVDTKGDLYRVHHSEAIHSMGYDAARRVMTITFMRSDNKSKKYEYPDVDAEFVKRLIEADHPWSDVGLGLRSPQ